jgi:hypothetical protein
VTTGDVILKGNPHGIWQPLLDMAAHPRRAVVPLDDMAPAAAITRSPAAELIDIVRAIDLSSTPVNNWQRQLANSDRFVTGAHQYVVLLAGTWPEGAASE